MVTDLSFGTPVTQLQSTPSQIHVRRVSHERSLGLKKEILILQKLCSLASTASSDLGPGWR